MRTNQTSSGEINKMINEKRSQWASPEAQSTTRSSLESTAYSAKGVISNGKY
jgi:hypothetical protein